MACYKLTKSQHLLNVPQVPKDKQHTALFSASGWLLPKLLWLKFNERSLVIYTTTTAAGAGTVPILQIHSILTYFTFLKWWKELKPSYHLISTQISCTIRNCCLQALDMTTDWQGHDWRPDAIKITEVREDMLSSKSADLLETWLVLPSSGKCQLYVTMTVEALRESALPLNKLAMKLSNKLIL